MGSLLACLKPICLLGNNQKKECGRRQHRELQKDEKKEQLLKNDKVTLRDYILNSPKSSSFPVTSNKRVYPNPLVVNEHVESLLVEDRLDSRMEEGDGKSKTTVEANLSSKGGMIKKRVSFRMPEVADVFILTDSPSNAHDLQVHDHH